MSKYFKIIINNKFLLFNLLNLKVGLGGWLNEFALECQLLYNLIYRI